jgi:hypothetical protein
MQSDSGRQLVLPDTLSALAKDFESEPPADDDHHTDDLNKFFEVGLTR